MGVPCKIRPSGRPEIPQPVTPKPSAAHRLGMQKNILTHHALHDFVTENVYRTFNLILAKHENEQSQTSSICSLAHRRSDRGPLM
jgi:hypothetical protein